MHGVLNLIKPPGMSSHDVVAVVRRRLREKRVGHTGTLDPAAAGVLPVCVGQATRLVEWLQEGTKEYVAEAVFGEETDSGDLLGQITAQAPTSHLTKEMLEAGLERFRGEIEQVPPQHSAVKVDGVRLYDLARAGVAVEVPSRMVTISGLTLEGCWLGEKPRARVRMQCSSGTYVRSLLRDWARACGSVATMSFLVRSRVGNLALEQAVTLEEFGERDLLPIVSLLQGLTEGSVVHDELAFALWQGKSVPLAQNLGSRVLVSNQEQTLLAVVSPRECGDGGAQCWYQPEKVMDLRQE